MLTPCRVTPPPPLPIKSMIPVAATGMEQHRQAGRRQGLEEEVRGQPDDVREHLQLQPHHRRVRRRERALQGRGRGVVRAQQRLKACTAAFEPMAWLECASTITAFDSEGRSRACSLPRGSLGLEVLGAGEEQPPACVAAGRCLFNTVLTAYALCCCCRLCDERGRRSER